MIARASRLFLPLLAVSLGTLAAACSYGDSSGSYGHPDYGKGNGNGTPAAASTSGAPAPSSTGSVSVPPSGTSSPGQTIPDAGLVGPVPWSPDAGTGAPPPPTQENGAAACGTCHATIYQTWRQAMHSNSMVSPVMIAETNQVIAGPLARVPNPDFTKFCINCHSPTVSAVATGDGLPQADSTQWRDGVSCTTCHQFNGTSELSSGGFTAGMQQGYNTGTTYFADLDEPVGNRYHTSQTGNAFTNPNVLCKNCHEVWIDRNQDGIEEKGIDLVLQETWDEYQDYKNFGGQETCVSCHMPAIAGLTRVADGAQIPNDQYTVAPPRVVHDHSFVGPDHLIDNAAQTAAQLSARTALLQSAAAIQFDRESSGEEGNGGIGVDLFVANVGAGHNLPSGFAFARQMWLEIKALDVNGNLVDSSGFLTNPTDDLCDGATLDDQFFNPMPPFFQNCRFIDGELTTFQQKLVSLVDFEQQDRFLVQDTITQDVQDQFGFETWLQYLTGGVVARQRFNESGNLAALLPFETREFHYDLNNPGAGGKVTARLLYRSLPPYFLRALASKQSASEEALGPLIANLETIVLATDELDF
ncbi:MAG: multiheme c-type cytochrome [Polyangiaceae bacterium]